MALLPSLWGKNWSYPTWASPTSNFPNSNLIVLKYSFPFFYSNSKKLSSFFLNHRKTASSINFLCFHLELLPISYVPQTSTLSSSGLYSKRLPSLELLSVSLGFHDSISYFSISISECSFIGPFYILLPLVPKYNIPQHLSLLFICSFHFLLGYLIPCFQ